MNAAGETALHRLVACQAHERALDPRSGRTSSRRFSLANITQVFAKVVVILTDVHPQMLLMYDYNERNTPIQLCLKLLNDTKNQTSLASYYESLFKTLCERLTSLLKLEKLSEEFVRREFSRKDASGNTLWHLVASSKNSKVLNSLGSIMKSVQGLNLYTQNAKGETPAVIALRNSFPQMASVLEEYRSSPTSLVHIVKMEMPTENDHCCCEQRSESHHDGDGPSLTLLDISNSSFMESSPIVNASQPQTPEQSFTEPLKKLPAIEQQKVVLTPAKKTRSDINGDVERDSRTDSVNCSPIVDPTMQEHGETGKNGEGEERLVIEKQIDLCVSVNESHDDNSEMSEDHKEMEIDQDLEHPQSMERSIPPLVETLLSSGHVSYCSGNIKLPSPPVSENSGCSCENETIPDPQTPKAVENNQNIFSKGVSVTPILLIKLLSEPDVSERFQSMLKEVITGDTEKVDSTQSTLQQLTTSRSRLENEIANGENSLQDLTVEARILSDSIKKRQQELATLRQSEESIKTNMVKLRQEKDLVAGKIHECESTCNHLKRRLSDCAGALNDLSPKCQKKC